MRLNVKMRSLALSVLAVSVLPWIASGQSAPTVQEPKIPKLGDVAISPSRLELPMMPGTEKTVVVNLIYTSGAEASQPTRVIAYLGDWNLSEQGKILFYPAGSQPNSASPWLVYSPIEVTVEPGRIHPIRVTISVPKDATPGDHLAALFVEPRPDNIKLEENLKQVQVKFRLAAVFYIMVPNLTRRGSLVSLKAEANGSSIAVTPRLKNEGNCHLRPTYSIKVFDQRGGIVAETALTESLPVLAKSEMEMPVSIDKALPAGNYSVRYRVSFGDGGALTEGQTDLLVKERLAERSSSAAPPHVQTTKPDKK
jgi:methionine-rich copper-binding protein CopC